MRGKSPSIHSRVERNSPMVSTGRPSSHVEEVNTVGTVNVARSHGTKNQSTVKSDQGAAGSARMVARKQFLTTSTARPHGLTGIGI
jgi:hypothetical protein